MITLMVTNDNPKNPHIKFPLSYIPQEKLYILKELVLSANGSF